MIDFRYHLVSLIAVFLAVALGIVIGTTALNNPISADIEARVDQLEQDKRQLEDRTQELTAQVDERRRVRAGGRPRTGRRDAGRQHRACWSPPATR